MRDVLDHHLEARRIVSRRVVRDLQALDEEARPDSYDRARRQHRPRRHAAPGAAHVRARPGVGGGRGAPRRRRRHHRAPARGPPPHPGRGRAPPARARPHQAQPRDGGDRRDGRHRLRASSRRWRCWCPKGGTRSPPKAASTSPGRKRKLRGAVAKLADAGIVTSVFIDADLRAGRGGGAHRRSRLRGPHRPVRARVPRQGPRCRERGGRRRARPRSAPRARRSAALGMRFNAGHALNYFNVQPVAALPGVRELHIGHAIVSRARVRRHARGGARDEGADARGGRERMTVR